MTKKLILIIFLATLVNSAFAQNNEEEEGIDTKTLAFGVTTSNHTSLIGGLIARSSTPISVRNNKTVFQYISLELLHLKNARELSQFSGFGPKFTNGKRNYLFSVRPQYGREFTLFQRTDDSQIGLGIIVAAGPSFGLLKPYYVKYEDNNAYIQYDPRIMKNITGVGGILKNGFKGIQFIPGLNAKIAANVDINTFGDNVTGLEFGLNVESFLKKPEILASTLADNPQTFTSVYLTLYFGNKKIMEPKKKKKSGNGID